VSAQDPTETQFGFIKTKGLHKKKAKKNQICSWCGQYIIKGEKYKFHRYQDEEFKSHRLHNECFAHVLWLKNDECVDVEFRRNGVRPNKKRDE